MGLEVTRARSHKAHNREGNSVSKKAKPFSGVFWRMKTIIMPAKGAYSYISFAHKRHMLKSRLLKVEIPSHQFL